MPNALTLADMSPGLLKVVEPRVTPTEEPDGGNLLVRIWRGAGAGNLPAYSTRAFSTAGACYPVAHPAPLEATSQLFCRPHAPRGRLAGRALRAAGAGSQAQGRRRRPRAGKAGSNVWNWLLQRG